jgi:hypothetical protein
MKKAKVMLMSIAVLAIVGGALAFKAKTYGIEDYCFTTTTAAGALCVSSALQSTINPILVGKYITTEAPENCSAGVACTEEGRPVGE